MNILNRNRLHSNDNRIILADTFPGSETGTEVILGFGSYQVTESKQCPSSALCQHTARCISGTVILLFNCNKDKFDKILKTPLKKLISNELKK